MRLFEGESEKHFHSEVLVLLFQITKNDMKEKLETGQSQIAALLVSAHAENNTWARRLRAAFGQELYLTSIDVPCESGIH